MNMRPDSGTPVFFQSAGYSSNLIDAVIGQIFLFFTLLEITRMVRVKDRIITHIFEIIPFFNFKIFLIGIALYVNHFRKN